MKTLARRFLRGLIEAGIRARSRPYPFAARSAIIVAPHEDDSTLGCGGLIAQKRLLGHDVRIAYLTDGSASHPGHPRVRPADLAAIREREATAAAEVLGVPARDLHFLRLPDGRLATLSEAERHRLRAELAAIAATAAPDELFVPCQADASTEHDAANRLLRDACAAARMNVRIYEYPIWSRWNPLRLIRPALAARALWRFEFPRLAPVKRRALAKYASQVAPLSPSLKPVLSPAFVRFFETPVEFFLEAAPP
jgi:LmbE family N-acetylglucosaminyl deacetylase